MRLITKTYMHLQEKLHRENNGYGSSGHLHATWITQTLTKYEGSSVLDYGCGKQSLVAHLPRRINYHGYDPAFIELRQNPPAMDLVACLDVMEHIEPPCLDEVIHHIHDRTKKVALFTISTRPAEKTLADGRNAHLTVKPWRWWPDVLAATFETQYLEVKKGLVSLEGTPK